MAFSSVDPTPKETRKRGILAKTGPVWMMTPSATTAFVCGGMEESLLLGQATTRLRSIHKEADEFLSFVVRSFKWEWQATFVQSMVDLVLEMQTVTLSMSHFMQNFEHYVQFSVPPPTPFAIIMIIRCPN